MKYLVSSLLLCLALTGCNRAQSEVAQTAPMAIPVSYPVEREITDYADYTGRTAAVDSVEVRAHVWGYLKQVNFKEGALVKKGDVLFEFDPDSFRNELIICAHLSTRYRPEEVRRIVEPRLPPSLRARVRLWV